MPKKKATQEHLAEAEAAMMTAALASANIQKYLEIHGASSAIYNMKIADESGKAAIYNMKIADEAQAGIDRIVADSVQLAADTLQSFIASRKSK